MKGKMEGNGRGTVHLPKGIDEFRIVNQSPHLNPSNRHHSLEVGKLRTDCGGTFNLNIGQSELIASIHLKKTFLSFGRREDYGGSILIWENMGMSFIFRGNPIYAQGNLILFKINH